MRATPRARGAQPRWCSAPNRRRISSSNDSSLRNHSARARPRDARGPNQKSSTASARRPAPRSGHRFPKEDAAPGAGIRRGGTGSPPRRRARGCRCPRGARDRSRAAKGSRATTVITAAWLARPTRQTCRSAISASPSHSMAPRMRPTTGESISRSSRTRAESRSSPFDHHAMIAPPTRPITGSSHVHPAHRPAARAAIASTEVNASASTCT